MEAYGIHTEQEGMLSWRWAGEQLERSHNYWICITRTDGRPHAMPVWGDDKRQVRSQVPGLH